MSVGGPGISQQSPAFQQAQQSRGSVMGCRFAVRSGSTHAGAGANKLSPSAS
jgi:hypothetical protein